MEQHEEKAYIRIYTRLKQDITTGVYPYGTKLPSKRIMAERNFVSVVTIEHSYALLCDEGYAESRERSGYFVIYRSTDFISDAPAHAARKTVRQVSVPKDSSIPFTVLAKTMRKVLLNQQEAILAKSTNRGLLEFRMVIAEYLARTQGIRAIPEQIVIGSGAEYLYSLIAQLFRGSSFALEDPSYEMIRRVYSACGIALDHLEMTEEGISSGALQNTQARILHVTPFNSYPSGITATASKRAEYIRWAEMRKGYIVEDNYESELTISTKNDSTVFSLAPNRVIYLNTFTKTVAPSIRTGYMVLPVPLLPVFEEKLGFYTCTVPVFEQYVLTELIDSGDFERHINRVRRARRRESE